MSFYTVARLDNEYTGDKDHGKEMFCYTDRRERSHCVPKLLKLSYNRCVQTDRLFKHINVPEIKIKHFDNTQDYVLIKKTKRGLVKMIKPKILEDIKKRLEDQ